MNTMLFTVISVVYLIFVSFFIAKKNQVLQWSFALFFVSIVLPSVFSYDHIWKVAGFGIVVIAAFIEHKLIRQPAQAALAAKEPEADVAQAVEQDKSTEK